jgi:hypothetical protein
MTFWQIAQTLLLILPVVALLSVLLAMLKNVRGGHKGKYFTIYSERNKKNEP